MSHVSEQRRTFVKWAAAAPVFGAIALKEMSQRLAAATGSVSNVYERIGVRPLINARGTWTYLSGSLIFPEVRDAMEAASRQFVDIFELQAGVGKKLAALSGAESAHGHVRFGGRDGGGHGGLHRGIGSGKDLAACRTRLD